MMRTPCLRYKGEFFGMFFEKADAMIIKVSALRVDELVASGEGMEFNFTKKRFKEWVLIPRVQQNNYPTFLQEALAHAKQKVDK